MASKIVRGFLSFHSERRGGGMFSCYISIEYPHMYFSLYCVIESSYFNKTVCFKFLLMKDWYRFWHARGSTLTPAAGCVAAAAAACRHAVAGGQLAQGAPADRCALHQCHLRDRRLVLRQFNVTARATRQR